MDMLLKQFIELYHNLYSATTHLNIVARNNLYNHAIINWKTKTRKELDKSSIQILLSIFEDYDTNYTNQIHTINIDTIINRFYCKLNLEYSPDVCINNYQKDYYSFYQLLSIIRDLSNIPPNVYTIIDDFINNRISICVHCNKLMTLENVSNCYHENHGQPIECDFTLTKVSNLVLHCNSNKSQFHPYGFDIDIQHSTPYFEDLLNRRLEKRILTQLEIDKYHPINIEDNNRLTLRYQEIIQKIVPNTIIYYHGLLIDLSHRGVIGTTTIALLRNKLENYKRIIKMEQKWDTIITTQINHIEHSLNDIILLNQSLKIEKNVFITKEEKTLIIHKARNEFSIFGEVLKKQLENSNQLNILLLDLEINTTTITDTILDSYYDQTDEAINNFYIAIEILELSTPLDSLIPIIKVHQFDLDNCSICLENDNEQEISKIEKCGHRFHTNCVKRWLVENNSCPICRSN